MLEELHEILDVSVRITPHVGVVHGRAKTYSAQGLYWEDLDAQVVVGRARRKAVLDHSPLTDACLIDAGEQDIIQIWNGVQLQAAHIRQGALRLLHRGVHCAAHFDDGHRPRGIGRQAHRR